MSCAGREVIPTTRESTMTSMGIDFLTAQMISSMIKMRKAAKARERSQRQKRRRRLLPISMRRKR